MQLIGDVYERAISAGGGQQRAWTPAFLQLQKEALLRAPPQRILAPHSELLNLWKNSFCPWVC